jgi:hypothetical protein
MMPLLSLALRIFSKGGDIIIVCVFETNDVFAATVQIIRLQSTVLSDLRVLQM